MHNPNPVHVMNEFLRNFPQLSKQVQEFVLVKGKYKEFDWPSCVFLPSAFWYAIVQGNAFRLPALSTLGTWRYTQGVYRVDPNVFEELKETSMAEHLPVDVFYNLPEWCVYVEMTGTKYQGNEVHGFWAHLDEEIKSKTRELKILINSKELIPVSIDITEGRSLSESLESAQKRADNLEFNSIIDGLINDAYLESKGIALSSNSEQNITFRPGIEDKETIKTMVSMLIYLCQDEPDVSGITEPEEYPKNPSPKKTKGGFKLFPADKPRLWFVGEKTGKLIRRASDYAGSTSGTKRPHLRRAHWHGFWSGPRGTASRVYSVKWLPPTFVGDKEDL